MPGPVLKHKVPCTVAQIRNAGWTFGVTDTVQIMHAHTRLRNSILDHFESPLSVVCGCISRKEAFARGCDVSMPDV